MSEFEKEVQDNIARLGADNVAKKMGYEWIERVAPNGYMHNFTWLGLPIIQLPQDIIALQEIIWRTYPDVIVELGIARGGGLAFYASMLELNGGGRVIGVDIDIREPNRIAIEDHAMWGAIEMIEGSSTDIRVVKEVKELIDTYDRVMVCLDSHHTHEHVLRELELYSPLVTRGCYLVVFDTWLEDLATGTFPDRPWGKGNNPKTAVWEFFGTGAGKRFEFDKRIQNKLVMTSNPDGYLRCVK